jgi:hypothetical protein
LATYNDKDDIPGRGAAIERYEKASKTINLVKNMLALCDMWYVGDDVVVCEDESEGRPVMYSYSLSLSYTRECKRCCSREV